MEINSTCLVELKTGNKQTYRHTTQTHINYIQCSCKKWIGAFNVHITCTHIVCNGIHFFTLRVHTFSLNCTHTHSLHCTVRRCRLHTERVSKDPQRKRIKRDGRRERKKGPVYWPFLFSFFWCFPFYSIPFQQINFLKW